MLFIVSEPQKEERPMNTIINNKDGRRSAAWTALLVLSFLAAIVLVAPTVVFAQITGQLSQDCEYALKGNDHTITATVTDGGAPGASEPVLFWSTTPYGTYSEQASFDEGSDKATFTYGADTTGAVEITLYWVKQDGTFEWVPLSVITTTWTDDTADLCPDPQAAPSVKVGGQVTLNAKKNGTLKIALCSRDDLEIKNVDLQSVYLAGVAPWQSKYKDSRLCPDGKDRVKDLVFKFKNRDLVQALEDTYGELKDGDKVDLLFTGSLKDKTSLDGTWIATIKKEGKMHWKKSHSNKNGEKNKGHKQ
jgi:hypothetical protein